MRLPCSRESLSERPKDQLARAGEEETAFLLSEKGYTILQRNLRFPEGELDLVLRDGKTLVFVEVKTRRPGLYGSPSLAVHPGKQLRILAMARRFQSLCRLGHVPIRFDIVTVDWPEDATPKLEHLVNAFAPDQH